MSAGYALTCQRLVARGHVLRHALQADGGVGDERQAPELAVVLAKVVGGEDRSDALGGSDGIGSPYGRMRAVEVGGLNFDVAYALFSGKPVFAGEQRGIGVGEGAARRDQGQADKRRTHCLGLRSQLWG